MKNKRLTAFQDSIYETCGYNHNNLAASGLHIVFNEITVPAQFVYVRTQIADCLMGVNAHASAQSQSLDDNLKRTFSITDEGWNLYLNTTVAAGYEVPRYSVDKTLRSLRTRPDKESE